MRQGSVEILGMELVRDGWQVKVQEFSIRFIIVLFVTYSYIGCEYGDRAPWCVRYIKGPKKCRRQDIAKQCCKSCSKYQRTDNAALG